ncbi:ACP phosphodiesterase [Shewanella colwelliana]|uniref:ACP phosphodiesterase n=1 Tax=Shewanella colwelliana TaxID=23 RepID=A0ABQ4NZ23_SHECO|nr:ACP phosphodiesterase [Shewanella colwelliana]MDX1280454.1 ACP phosphodiesterase [Shewanella colwelliana]GIU26308.1 ACP phosphodiesterase [Shewanella colwelliana]GIU39788.1 ACP phosphodiesterase [Shewanella colwelliana]
MNFLAHLHLADNSNTSLAANLAGDFAKGNISDHPKRLQQGIWLHRQIDALTDSHELTKELRQAFPANLQRAAPILIDLAFDHILAKYWDEYHNQTLADFAQTAYDALDNTAELPKQLIDIIPNMRQQNWLLAYEGRSGLNQTIESVAKRVSKPEIFNGAVKTVEKMDIEIEIAFRTFYPQLMAYSRIWTRQTPAEYL